MHVTDAIQQTAQMQGRAEKAGFAAALLGARHKLRFRVVTGQERGRACWFIIRLLPEHEQAYQLAMKSTRITLAEHAEILESGWGETPPEARLLHWREHLNP